MAVRRRVVVNSRGALRRCRALRVLVLAGWVVLARALSAPPARSADLLRVEEVVAPARVPAGSTVPLSVQFRVVEPIRNGWRVSASVVPAGPGPTFAVGPVSSQFHSGTPPGTVRTLSFAIPIAESAPRGTYRLRVEHYDQVNGQWVYVRYQDAAGRPMGVDVGQIQVLPALAPLPPPAPQRRSRPGEVHTVFECEDFAGMDGGGNDLGMAAGWTWYSDPACSRGRAAANNTGKGAIQRPIRPPLPPGSYKVLLRSVSPFCTFRVRLGVAAAAAMPLRSGWSEVGVLRIRQPASRLTLEAVQRIGDYAIADAIYVTNDLSARATAGLDPSRQFLPADARPVKRRRTIWTEDYLRGVRQRIRQYPTVKAQADSAIAEARRIAALTDAQLWNLLADTRIRRTHYVNQARGCPICGLRIKQFDNFHPWILDPIRHPFKLQCPSCKRFFPTNDFARGEMKGGEFPDDGTGCRIGGEVYHFLGEYTHFAYLRTFLPYLRALTHGVVLTGDRALAHKAAVMLLRAAEQYPNSEDRAGRAFSQAWRSDGGCITDTVWSSYEGRDYGQAYDAVFPFLDRDAALLARARRRLPGARNPEDVRLYIEENLLRRIGQAYCDTVIQGNPGYHHKGMAWLLLALDDNTSSRFPNCRDLLEFLHYRVYGGVRYFGNLFGRDGSSFESPGYNTARLNMLEAISVLDRFFSGPGRGLARDRYPSLWRDPRFRAQFGYFTDYVLLDRWPPAIGDAGGDTVIPRRTPPTTLSMAEGGPALEAWRHYRDPALALLAYGLEGKPPQPSLWLDVPLQALAASRRQAPSRLERRSTLLDDYGLAILRSGEGEDARALWAWYGQLLDHGHDDKLSYGLSGKGLDLLPDLGYPKSWEHARRWEAHALTHNTLTVDGSAFPTGWARGRARLLGRLPGFQVVEVETGALDGDGPAMRRLLGLVDLDAREFYSLDEIIVRAGAEHMLSYHGPQARISVEGVALSAQARGTAAGEDVEYGRAARDASGREVLSPLAHMVDVRRGDPDRPFAVEYALGDDRDTRVRLHLLPDAGTRLVLGTGRPPAHPDAYAVHYSLQVRRGAAPLSGHYLTVVEPYCGRRAFAAVDEAGERPTGPGRALQVVHRWGSDLLLLDRAAVSKVSSGAAQFTGRAALVRHDLAGVPRLAVAYAFTSLQFDGVSLRAASPYLEGTIAACDYARRTIVVPGMPADRALVGASVRIHNGLRSSLHLIAGVARRGSAAELTLTTTALRHEGACAGVGAAIIRDGAPSPWAFDTFLAGTRLVNEGATASWVVAGASGGWWSAPLGTLIRLADAGRRTSERSLRQALTDVNGDGIRAFRLYEYGAGDQVEIASFAWLERQPGGAWVGILSPGVEVEPARSP